MKKSTYIFLALVICFVSWSYYQKAAQVTVLGSRVQIDTSMQSVEGAWQLVWGEYDNQLADMRNHYLFKTFNDGIFSLIAHDSTKKINFAGYGKYDFKDGIYHETFIYHNNPKYVGGEDWQNLIVLGDTMYLNGFNKIMVEGKDVTAGWTKVKEKLIRVK